MSDARIRDSLAGVRRRLGCAQCMRSAAWGLLIAAGIGLLIGSARLTGWISLPPAPAALLLLAGPVAGVLAGLLRRPAWESAAAAVDEHYSLKDRAATAVAFLRRPAIGQWQSLAVEDAARHLAVVNAKEVVPYRWPRSLSYGLIPIAAAVVLWVWPTAAPVQASPIGPNAGLVAIAEELETDLDELEQRAVERQDEKLKEVVKELRQLTDSLQQDDIQLKETLATLSRMQTALQQHSEYNAALVDAQLGELATAMSTAEALQPTAQHLKAGELKQASEELTKLESAEPARRSDKAAAERMQKLAEQMKEKGLASLGASVSEISDGLSGEGSDKFCQGCKSLASQLKKHGDHKQMSSLLRRQVDKLSECKSQCSMCFGGQCQGGGQCDKPGAGKNSLAEGLKPSQSTSPKTSWGKSTSGNLFGARTDLPSSGNREQITGQKGDGPSDVETTTSPEGREESGRTYQQRYEKYQKLSEEVLAGEPIPLGHRQTIRNYFELIRPDGTPPEPEQTDRIAP